MRFTPMPSLNRLLPVLLIAASSQGAAFAAEQPLLVPPQSGRYTPLDQREVPGKVARWNLIAKPSLAGYFQPVQIRLPTQGSVSFFTPDQPQAVVAPAPAQASFLIGPVYRLRIAGLPEYPGVELYPTLELTDRLHPPAGREEEFPVPVEITAEEIEAALADQMVTKVIYLERPQNASVLTAEDGHTITFDARGDSNLLDAADQLGRPVAILRLGGRTPDPNNPADLHLGPPAPIRITAQRAVKPGVGNAGSAPREATSTQCLMSNPD